MALDFPVSVFRGPMSLKSFPPCGFVVSGVVVLSLGSAALLPGCAVTPVVEAQQVACEASDEQILTFASASAERVGATFLSPENNHVELFRHGGRIGYVGARYLPSHAVEMHRELIIWMQCNGVTDTVHVGQSVVYQRTQ